jgi:hypothetical protein
MNKAAADVKPANARGATRSNASAVERQHSLGAHLCVQRDVVDPAVDPAAPALVRSVLNSPGQPLDTETRSFMEQRFEHDFGRVRIHTDEPAADSAQGLGANAYAVHNHIAFAPGKYEPETETGKRLIAHELTHVVQRGSSSTSAGQQDRGLEITEPSDATEHVADQIGRGQRDASKAGSVDHGSARVSGASLVQRQKAQQTQSPAPAAAKERQIGAGEAWLFAENRLVTELETRYGELVRVAAFQTKRQISDFFTPYDDDIKADAPFSTFLNIAGAGAGNSANDPSSIQPAPAGSPRGTPSGPIPQTFSVTGSIAGALSASITPLVSLILDTSEVSGVRENLNTKVEQFLVEELTTSSPTYGAFESQARSEMQQFFLSNWSETDRRHDASGLSDLINETAQHARSSYGASSTVGGQVIAAVRDYVKSQLDLIQPVLDELERKHRRARIGAFALGGALAGGLLGGALGFGLGGGGGLVAGALGGVIAGGVVGMVAGGITNAVTPDAAEIRRRRALEAAQEEERRKRRAPDILEPKYRPPQRPDRRGYA